MRRECQPRKLTLTVEIDCTIYTVKEIQSLQKGSIQTARRRMRLYNNGSLSKEDLLRLLRKGSPVYVSPCGASYSIRELRKVVKCSFETAQNRLLLFERGSLSISELLAAQSVNERTRSNRGTNEWAALRSSKQGKEQRRMAKALLNIPEPGYLEAQYQ